MTPPWEGEYNAKSQGEGTDSGEGATIDRVNIGYPWFLKHYRDMAAMLNRWIDSDLTFANLDDYPTVMDLLYNGIKCFDNAVVECSYAMQRGDF